MSDSPSIVMLVVDVREQDQKLVTSVQYWLEFITLQCREEGPKPHLVLICSHTDQTKNTKFKLQLALSQIESYELNCVGHVMMDCRYAGSSSMSELRLMLKRSCLDLRSLETVAVEQHCFLVFLLDRFKNRTAITLGETKVVIRSEPYFKFLKSHNLLEICDLLNKRGDILFMKNHHIVDNSWIILKKSALLSTVTGILFAPEGFKIATSTGVVLHSKLVSLFRGRDLDINMITTFLCHFEFCYEIADRKLLELLPADDTMCQVGSNERFYFFPGLVHDVKPQDLWMPDEDLGYHLGWIIKCCKPKQFLTPRFLHVLLLRLAFDFAIAPSEISTVVHPALQRECKIWKNGIFWVNVYGGRAIVEVTDMRQIVILTRCDKQHKLESVRLLSSVIHEVLRAKSEHCPNVILIESVILSEEVSYPLDPAKVSSVSIMDVAKHVNENAKFFVVNNSQILVEKFLYFEPYLNLGDKIVRSLLDEHNPDHHQQISKEFIYEIAEKFHDKSGSYVAVLKNQRVPTFGGEQEIVQELQKWIKKMGSEATRCNLHKQLDQFSVFAGRNPLKVAEGTCLGIVCACLTLHALLFLSGEISLHSEHHSTPNQPFTAKGQQVASDKRTSYGQL